MCSALALIQASLNKRLWISVAKSLLRTCVTFISVLWNFDNFANFWGQILNTKMGCDYDVKFNVVQVKNFSPLILYQLGSCLVVSCSNILLYLLQNYSAIFYFPVQEIFLSCSLLPMALFLIHFFFVLSISNNINGHYCYIRNEQLWCPKYWGNLKSGGTESVN